MCMPRNGPRGRNSEVSCGREVQLKPPTLSSGSQTPCLRAIRPTAQQPSSKMPLFTLAVRFVGHLEIHVEQLFVLTSIVKVLRQPPSVLVAPGCFCRKKYTLEKCWKEHA
jgi:hypothetical protein